MSEEFQPTSKAELLAHIQTSYEEFEALIAGLSEEQMTTPSVNGTWSAKDNLSHLTAWQDYQSSRQEGILSGNETPDPVPGATNEDEQNEFYYQKFKDQPLPEVLMAFRAS